MRRLWLTFTGRGNDRCTGRIRRLLQSRLQPALVETLPLGGTLGRTRGSGSFRRRPQVLVGGRRAGGAGGAGGTAGSWLRVGAGPGGGTAATDRAGFHQ